MRSGAVPIRLVETYDAYRGCYEKTAFLTKDEANRMSHDSRKKNGLVLSAYRCKFCTCWHLTSQKTKR